MTNKNIVTDKKFVALAAIVATLLWGSAYPAVKSGYVLFNIASADIQAKLVFAGYRFILAGIIVLFISKLMGRKIFGISKKNLMQLIILGITQTTLQYIFFYIGIGNTTGVKGSILNSTGTFFSVILAHIIYKDDKLNSRKIFGCILGFVGVIFVNFSTDLLHMSFKLEGEGFVTMAALVFAASAIYGKKICREMDAVLVTGYSLFIGGSILALMGLLQGGRITHFTVQSSSLLVYMGFLSAVAFSLWTLLLKYNKVGQVSVFNFLVPVFGAILSAIFLGEKFLEMKNIFALAFVCIGILIVNSDFGTEKKPTGKNVEKVS